MSLPTLAGPTFQPLTLTLHVAEQRGTAAERQPDPAAAEAAHETSYSCYCCTCDLAAAAGPLGPGA